MADIMREFYPEPTDTFNTITALQEEEERERAAEIARQEQEREAEIARQYTPEIGPPMVPGASEAAMEEREAAKGPLPDMIDTKQDSLNAKIALLQGTGDTAFGALKGLGWLAGGGRENSWIRQGTAAVDDYWHQLNPQSDNGAHHARRK